MSHRPTKVAIIGGGCAGIAAAFELSRPQHEGRYEVTVYQLGWRLGGKGASGRGPNARIEEHGLHLWMGFYENAFRLMRECYSELGRDRTRCRIADWTDAFAPDHHCGVMDRSPSGHWSPWTVTFPALAGNPGDTNGIPRWSVLDYLQRTVSLLRTLFETIQASGSSASSVSRGPGPTGLSPGEIMRSIARLMSYGGLAGLSGLIQGLGVLDEIVRMLPRVPSETILRFHAAIAASARAQLATLTKDDAGLRRLGEIIELVLATVRGIIAFRLTTDPRGFDAIDDYDCREWLQLNGASKQAVDSAFLRALYDLAFAYEGGDVTRPGIAAGQALRGAVRAFFTYRGAFFWKMQSGMGDVVFAPFYEVLARRGVTFEFFHRLTNVGLTPSESLSPGERPHVERLDFQVQAKVRDGKPYAPLVDVDGLPCWPSEPDFEQLMMGAQFKRERRQFESHWDQRHVATKTLRVQKDFDFVVLAVGIGAVPHVCSELVARDPRWQQMVDRVQSVPTQALQLWLSEDIAQLGWRGPSTNLSGYVEPFDTWADMPQLIREERHPRPVKSIAYFCSVLSDPVSAEESLHPDYPERRRAEVRSNAIRFVERDLQLLWPNAVHPDGGFRWDLLVGPKQRGRGETLIDSQYYRANVEPTDRYCLSLPGTLKLRISPLDSTYDNLTVAGDWTACGFMEGCVEAAVMSGRLAAHAIAQSPRLEEIAGFDHP